EPVELVNVRLAARGLGTTPRGLPGAPAPPAKPAAAGRRLRRAYFGEHLGRVETPLIARADLEPPQPDVGAGAGAGPLIIEEYDATTLVPAGWTARLGPAGTIVLEKAP